MRLLTFEEPPSWHEMSDRAHAIARIAEENGAERAMIGGAPFFMAHLESALKAHGVVPIYAFSRRESVERTLPDGSVQKTNVFRHVGFVEAL